MYEIIFYFLVCLSCYFFYKMMKTDYDKVQKKEAHTKVSYMSSKKIERRLR